MTQTIADLLQYGRKIDYYIEDATDTASGNLKFDSATGQQYVVPTGCRWYLLYGQVVRDAAETVTVSLYNASDKRITFLVSDAAGTTSVAFPNQKSSITHLQAQYPLILDAGDYVDITFGGNQGAGAKANISVIEVDL